MSACLLYMLSMQWPPPESLLGKSPKMCLFGSTCLVYLQEETESYTSDSCGAAGGQDRQAVRASKRKRSGSEDDSSDMAYQRARTGDARNLHTLW